LERNEPVGSEGGITTLKKFWWAIRRCSDAREQNITYGLQKSTCD